MSNNPIHDYVARARAERRAEADADRAEQERRRDLPGYKQDASGRMVPLDMIKPQDLLTDELVLIIADEAARLSADLARFKARAMAEVAALRETIAGEYGAELGGRKGNVTLTSFDGRLQVQVAIGEAIAFGPELEAAKALIDGCIERWAATSGAEIRALVEHAFQVNKAGRIDTQRVLGLRRLDIDDTDWRRAMDAIGDAVRVTATKAYLRVYRRDPQTDDKIQIPLDLAGV